ncbi:iron-containing alcohol dehydrogenase [Telmatospirillum sp. J64-1]|uniref:iron-containing alcohol dehydrogenase n=1 Tax=Telmatospirillum sp. J64-1 TaxID=2502183 RepID=UPI00115E2386|nr:iron-containing alcohol dehydrogenase [Telmatospirillum sp. J64-1]
MNQLSAAIEMLRPAKVLFGFRQIETLQACLTEAGCRRVLVVSDAFNATRIDVLGLAEAPAVFGTIQPEPDVTNLEQLVSEARRFRPDAIVGFGGGSAMDCAKLAAVLADNQLAIRDIAGKENAPKRRCLLIQVPTTAGTGSEAGTRALVTDPDTLNKIAVESRHMLADIAIIDPLLTVSVPGIVTAATGVDALAHCVEALTSKKAHPIIDAYALEGIKLIGRYLKRAIADGEDIEARSGLALGSFYGGICLGPVNTTAGHAVAYPLGTRYKIAHGAANALIFPHTLAFNAPACGLKTRQVCTALGLEETEDQEQVFRQAYDFCKSIGLQMTLSGYNVAKEDLSMMADEAFAIRRLLDNNPREISRNDILEIYETAF